MEPEFPLVGMAKEQQRLSTAFGNCESLLILGPRGCGKTRLIKESLRDRQSCLCVAWEPTLHGLLLAMARLLIAAGHSALLGRAKPGIDRAAWISRQTSIHLRGLLWTALEQMPVPLVLDGITGAGFPTYRFLQRIYHTPGMTILATARDAPGMGALNRLFWDPRHIMNIAPLSEREAGRLFDLAVAHFNLRDLDLDEFREKALESAAGNPGLIIEMCRLATEAQYVAGRHVKFAPLRIDTLIRFAG